MAAARGKKGRTPNIHLLREAQAGACTPSAAFSSGFVGGLSDRVGSSNFTTPLQRKDHEYQSGFFLLNLFLTVWIVILCDLSSRNNKEKNQLKKKISQNVMAEQTVIYVE